MTVSRSNWTGVAFGLALACFAAYQQFKLPPALPVLLETYHYDRTLAGAFMSIYAVAGFLLSAIFGRLVERSGLAGPTLAALALTIAGNVLILALPENGWLVLGGRALEGIGFAVLAICGPLLANASAAPRHLPIVVGLTASWIPVGQLAATALAPAAFAWYGWQLLWIAAIAAALALAGWTLRLRGSAAIELPASLRTATEARGDTGAAAQRRRLVLAAAVFMFWTAQYFAYMTWLPQYLVEVHGLSVSMAAVGYTVPVVMLILTNLVVGTILRAGVPVGPLLAFGLATQAAVWWLIPVTGGGVTGLLSLIIYGIAAGICPTCLFAMPSIVVGQGRGAATAFGTLMTGRNVGVLVGPVLLAQAFKETGAWDIAVPIFGTITSLAFVLGVWLAVSLGGTRYGTSR